MRNIMDHYVTPASNSDKEQAASARNELLKPASSRRTFLRGSLVGAAIVVPSGLLAACGASATGSGGPTPGPTSTAGGQQQAAPMALRSLTDSKQAFTEIMNDENQHVTFLQAALKSAARPKPTFKNIMQMDIQSFANVSRLWKTWALGRI